VCGVHAGSEHLLARPVPVLDVVVPLAVLNAVGITLAAIAGFAQLFSP
jgi:hypothetical protein